MIVRPAWLALAVSLVAHAVLLGGIDVRLTTPLRPDLPEPFVQARLLAPPLPLPEPAPAPAAPAKMPAQQPAAPPPSAAAKTVAKPAPRPRPAPRAAPAAAPPAVEVAMPSPAPAGVAAAVKDAPVGAPLPQVDALAGAAFDEADMDGWPRRGSIVFRVMLGDEGFEVGQARHAWSHDTKRYEMSVELKTTGVAALMRSFHYTQRSEGEVGERGLRPLRFTVEQRGRASDAVDFDWQAGEATIRRGGREPRTARILPGDQDVLSLWHQVGIVGAGGLPTTLTVLSNKSAKPALLEVVGTEAARLPIGRLDTLRLRAQAEDGSLTIDIWLASRYGMLPVRIRVADDEGEVLDQQAIQLRLTPVEAGAAEASAAQGDSEPGTAAAADMIELKEEVAPVADLYTN